MRLIQRFLRDDSGATAMEYGLIAGLIGVVIIAAVRTTGTNITNKFTAVGNNLT